MSNAHAAPKSGPTVHVDMPHVFNPLTHAVEDLPLESFENMMEDLAKKGYKGKGLVKEFLKKHEWFLEKRKLTLPVVIGIAAVAAKVAQRLGLGGSIPTILYELSKHGLGGLAEGAHESIKASKEEQQEAWHDKVEHVLDDIPDELTELGEDTFAGRVRKGDNVVHASDKACSDITTFEDGHESGKTDEKIHVFAVIAGAPANDGGGKGKKGATGGVLDKEFKGGDKKVEYHKGNIADLLQHGNNRVLCKLCFPDGMPKEKKHDEHHEKGLRDKFGDKALAVFNAATTTISRLPISKEEKSLLNDSINEWTLVDPDIVKEKVQGLTVKDRRLSVADLEDFINMIDADGKLVLSKRHALQQVFGDLKKSLGFNGSHEQKPLLEEHGPQLVDFMRASEEFYENGFETKWFQLGWRVRNRHQQQYAHLKEIENLPDLGQLGELAAALWTPALRSGSFEDEAQFNAWNSAVELAVKAHHIDKKRRHVGIHKVEEAAKKWGWRIGVTAFISSLVYAIGWTFDKQFAGVVAVCVATLPLMGLILTVLPMEWFFSIFDVVLKDKNRTDDTVKSVRQTLTMALGLMTEIAIFAYKAQLADGDYILLFVGCLAASLLSTAALEKAGAYTTLQRSRKVLGIAFGILLAVLVGVLVYSGAQNQDPNGAIPILHKLNGFVAFALLAGVLFVAWKAFWAAVDKGSHDGHTGFKGYAVAFVVAALVVGAGVKVLFFTHLLGSAGPDVVAKANTEAGSSVSASAEALEKAAQRAKDLMAQAHEKAPTPDGQSTETPAPAPAPAPKAKSLKELQAREKVLTDSLKLRKEIDELQHKQSAKQNQQVKVAGEAASETNTVKKNHLEEQAKRLQEMSDDLGKEVGDKDAALKKAGGSQEQKWLDDAQAELKTVQAQIAEHGKPKETVPTVQNAPLAGQQGNRPALSEKAKASCKNVPESIRNDPNSFCYGV